MTRQAWWVVGLLAWAGCKGGSGQGSSGGTTVGITDATSSGSAGGASGSSTGGSTGGKPDGWGQSGKQCCRYNSSCECFTTTVCLDGCLNDDACPYWCGASPQTVSSTASSSGTSVGTTGGSTTGGSGSTGGSTGVSVAGDQAFPVAASQLTAFVDQGQLVSVDVVYSDSASLHCNPSPNSGVAAVGRVCQVHVGAASGSAVAAGTYQLLQQPSSTDPFASVGCYLFYPDGGVDPTLVVGEGGSVVLTTATPSRAAGSFDVVTSVATGLVDGGIAKADGGSLSGSFDVRNPCP